MSATEPEATAPDTPAAHDPGRRGASFWIGLLLGGAVMAYGVTGLLDAERATQPRNLAAFFLGAGIVHDAVLAPVVVVIGWLIARVLPPWVRAPVWFALAASGILLVFTWPLVRGWGRRAANPSLLPLDYGRNVAVGLAVIWALALADVVRRVVVHRRSS
jgi:hypothetical protein